MEEHNAEASQDGQRIGQKQTNRRPGILREKFVMIRPLKSMAIAILIALFLGPIGLLYSSFLGGVVMAVIVFIFIAAATANLAVWPLIMVAWLVCPFWAVLSTGQHNKAIMTRWDDEHHD